MAKGRAGNHSSVIDAAKTLVALLEEHGRVSRGMIEARVGAGGHTIKILPLDGALRVTVVAKGAKQEFHVYGIPLDKMKVLLADKSLKNFLVRIAE
ncbi:MAG: hypothetical protein LBV12_12530 [Puniceicoccales bacterium]|jgi:acyl CoA:acetate/3-ketoacid CoA transferase alpha subunit|nr:hypothetical protein [Puniceicoccales bacterium]